jgi:hypothetical protein
MQITIYQDESISLYDFFPTRPENTIGSVEIPDAEIAKLKAVFTAFDHAQDRLRIAYQTGSLPD